MIMLVRKLGQEIQLFWKNKVYLLLLCLSAICSYGWVITHNSIGVDDTAVPLYFEEGLAPYVGRWTLFLINRLFHISDFVPWMTELVSVLIFMVSVTLWCVVFRRICGEMGVIPIWCYGFIAGIFISCPIITEVYVFYLHNGICIGYGMVALALICLTQGMLKSMPFSKRVGYWMISSFFLTVALGCYESFAVVYAMGAVMLFFIYRGLFGKKGSGRYISGFPVWMAGCVGTGIMAVLLRTLILAGVKVIFGLEKLSVYNSPMRGIFSGLPELSSEFFMELKRFWVKYYVNAVAYFPIKVLVVSFIFIGLYSVYAGIKKRDILLPLCAVAIVLLPVFMCVIEGIATRYRTAQYMPLVGAFAILLLWIEVYRRKWSQTIICVCSVLLCVLLWNQCMEMNKWFYEDYRKYEDARDTMNQVAYDLESGYDVSKPIVFYGAYRVPYEICKDAYCSFDSKEFKLISRITDAIDPHLKEKFYGESKGRGYVFAEMPVVSTLQWAIPAFDGSAEQLFVFMEMHGHSFVRETDRKILSEAEQLGKKLNMPGFPQDGYIRDCGEYILVNMESEP